MKNNQSRICDCEKDCGQCYCVIKPIAITEEWLVRLGFKKSGNVFYKGNFKVLINQLPEGSTGYDKYIVYKGIALKNVSWVHSLQNTYFELKGEEL